MVRKFSLLFVSLSFLGCGKISNTINARFKNPFLDFKKSEIISNGPGIADGQTELLMAISLLNSDSSPVKDFKPTYEILSGTGVIPLACTASNINGVSTCLLKATEPGVKRVSVTNIPISLEAEVVFNSPQNKPMFGLTSAGKMQTSGAYSLSATIGNQEPGAVRTSGGHKLFGGVQGEAFSR